MLAETHMREFSGKLLLIFYLILFGTAFILPLAVADCGSFVTGAALFIL